MVRTAAAAMVLILAGIALLAWRPEWMLAAEYARLRWLAGAHEQTLEAAGHRWAYLQAGPADATTAAPTIVLIHGFTGIKESWLPLMAGLSRDFRVIAPDLAGWNASSRQPDGDYGIAAQAERLAGFIEALGEPPALLVGHSMGGHIAGVLAAERPELVPRLALMASAGVRFRETEFTSRLSAQGHPFAVSDRASLDRYLALVFTDPPFIPWPADRALIAQRRADDGFERAVLDRITREPEVFLLQSKLTALTMPIGLLWCQDDRVIDLSAGLLLSAALPQSRLVVLDGCGHMPQMERPDDSAAAIRMFAAMSQ